MNIFSINTNKSHIPVLYEASEIQKIPFLRYCMKLY